MKFLGNFANLLIEWVQVLAVSELRDHPEKLNKIILHSIWLLKILNIVYFLQIN